MSFNLQGSGSAGGGSIVVSDNHIFVDTAARDSYFVSNPSELVNNVYVYITGTSSLNQYRTATSSWADVTPTIRGPKGDTGEKGDTGSFPTIHDLTEKTTLVNNDVFIIEDSENSYAQRKVKKSNLVTGATWGAITGTLSEQGDLDSALASKVNTTTTVNGQALSSNVTITIPDELSDLAADSTHRVVTDTQITTWNNKQDFASRGVANGYCPLGSDSKIPSAYIGQITVTSVFPTSVEPATPSEGMVWINLINSVSKIYDGDTATWYELGNSAGYVTTINGYSGPTVTLNKSDIGLGSVVNIDTTNASNITSGTLSSTIFPTATPSALGGIKVGSGLSITGDGTLSSTGSIGEANTASNVGTGTGTIFKQKTGVDLELKTIKAGTNVTITNNASDITINSSASGTIGGSTGSIDNAIIRADGTGGSTLQNSLVTIDDSGSVNIPTGQSYKINGSTLTYSDVSASSASHIHGNVTNDGKVGSTSGVPLITGTAGIVQAGSFGTDAGTFCQGNDSRLSDSRAPNITGLTAETSIADDDLVPIYDTSASANRKMTKANFVAGMSGSLDIHGLTSESGIVSGDELPFYDLTASANRKVTLAQLQSALSISYSPWSQVTAFTATPASTSTITTSSDLSGTIHAGYPLKYTIGGTTYYGIVTAITSNLITVSGPSLSGDVTALYYGDPSRVVQLDFLIPGYYEDATNFTLFAADLGQCIPWRQAPAYIAYASVRSRVVDGSSNGTWNLVKTHNHAGTAQAGAATTITLSSRASAVDDAYNNLYVAIVAGAGNGQIRQISDYVGSTKVATVSTWTTNPDATSEYKILLGDPSSSSGILTSAQTIAYPKEWYESGVLINSSMYQLTWGSEVEIYVGVGTGMNAQDLSGVIALVLG